MSAKPRKTTKIEIYEDDLPIIAAFMEHSESKTEPEAFRFGVRLLEAMADDVRRLRGRGVSMERATYIS